MSPVDDQLIDMIRRRFDDLKADIQELKQDMLRESASRRRELVEHKQEDNEHFNSLKADMEDQKKFKWLLIGGAGLAVIIIEALANVLQAFPK